MQALEVIQNSEKFSTESLTRLLNLGFSQWQDTRELVELPLPDLEQMHQDFQIEQGVFVNGDKRTTIPDSGIYVASRDFYLKYFLTFFIGNIDQDTGKLWIASRHVENRGLDKSLDGGPIQGQQLAKLYDPIIVQAAANYFKFSILSSQNVPFRGNGDLEQIYWECLGYSRTKRRFEYMDRIFTPES